MRGRGPGFGEVLGVAEFRALWAAELLSILGDQLARVALALLVFQRTSSAALSALTYALTFAPAVLGGALLSGLADRYPRRQVLVATDLLRAALAGAMALPGVPLPVLWALVGLLSMATAPFKAAQLALLPLILTDDRYVVGLSLRQITGQSAQLVGFATGGLLLAAVEPHLALALNAATFLASAGLILLGVRARPAAASAPADPAAANGAGPLPASRRLLPVIVLMCLASLFVVPEGLAAPYGSAVGVGSIGVGLLMAADPLGSVVGAWLTARIRVRPSPTSAILLAAASGVPLLLCGPGPGLVLSITLWAVSGALSTAYLIQTQAIVVTLVPDHRRGRVMGRIATCLYTSQGAAIVSGGLLAEAVGPFRSVAAAGLLGIVFALCVGTWWRPVARSRRDLAAGSERDPHTMGSHQMSLLAITGSSSRTGCGAGDDDGVQMSLLATAGSSFHGDRNDGKTTTDQMSLLATAGTSFSGRHQHVHCFGEMTTDQMSLLATANTSSSDHEHHVRETIRTQMSLLATAGTSFDCHTSGNGPGQMSLLAITGSSFPKDHALDTGKKTSDQMSLLAMAGTSFQAGCRVMRRAGRFLEMFPGHGIVDWGRKRPHYGGAVG